MDHVRLIISHCRGLLARNVWEQLGCGMVDSKWSMVDGQRIYMKRASCIVHGTLVHNHWFSMYTYQMRNSHCYLSFCCSSSSAIYCQAVHCIWWMRRLILNRRRAVDELGNSRINEYSNVLPDVFRGSLKLPKTPRKYASTRIIASANWNFIFQVHIIKTLMIFTDKFFFF